MPDLTDADQFAVDYMGDIRAVANAAGVSSDRATAIIARLASDENGQRLLITYEKWTGLDAEITRLRAALAALVEVAADACSDETAHDPGVMRLMRHLAAHHPTEETDV